ncbi:MAG TPA: penicillin-insensitive murein endopeptidase [Polyangiaceae bacterium]|nr:penicillin-insensitive murein endopeptidase [Polyangiaceae bacterium]
MTHRGVLAHGEEMPAAGRGYGFLRDNGRHFATRRFARAVESAAAAVDKERPGATLVIGDASSGTGGQLPPHFSHRAGRDVDLLFYWLTPDGAPVSDHGFLHAGPDGLAWDEVHKRFLRLDVERQWLLVRALLTDETARVQWIFVHDNVKSLLLEWAEARGEPTEIVWRASQVMLQPNPGGLHDDHIHVRTACDADERVHGCEPFGPERPWLALPPPALAESDTELVASILSPNTPANAIAVAVPPP